MDYKKTNIKAHKKHDPAHKHWKDTWKNNSHLTGVQFGCTNRPVLSVKLSTEVEETVNKEGQVSFLVWFL